MSTGPSDSADCDLTFWADLKSKDAQGHDRTPPHYLAAFGKQLCCCSEVKFRALIADDQPASYLHAFDWLDGLWNGQLNQQPSHVAVCTALLEHAFLKGLHVCVDAAAAANGAAATDALATVKQAMVKKFGEEKRFETAQDKQQGLDLMWQMAFDSADQVVRLDARAAASRRPYVLRSFEATLEGRRLETLPPIGPILDLHLPRYSSPLFLKAKQRDARADLLGTVRLALLPTAGARARLHS